MSLVVKEIVNDMKCKIKEADKYIRKANETKMDYPSLSKVYYDFSVESIDNMLELHKEVEYFIEKYRKEKGQPPTEMLTIWDWEHKNIIEMVEEIKVLQDLYGKI